MTIRIAGVSCSRRAKSYTRRAVRYALATAREAGAETDFIDLGDVDLPLYHPDRDEQGESVALKRRVRLADGVLLGSPVYHGSYSSTFRNFHDYCGWDEYEDTTVGLIAVAGGGSYASTLDHLRITVRGVHGYVVPEQVGIRNASDKFEGDRPIDEDIADRLESLGEEVVRQARYRMLPVDSPER
ncbi:MAG: NAD(P)H-dependent oxidoreductase [Halobacteriales archaeon]|nr:NAD(P)H-dependent oxidoreductase [Halobacteriales archaeon]